MFQHYILTSIIQLQKTKNPQISYNIYHLRLMSNQLDYEIDFDEIRRYQGSKIKPYVLKNSQSSGVTIATGIDLGQQNEQDFRKYDLPYSIIYKFRPFLGLKGKQAWDKLENVGKFTLTKQQLIECQNYIYRKYYDMLTKQLKAKGIDIKTLPKYMRTILFSRVIHTGRVSNKVIQLLKVRDYYKIADVMGNLDPKKYGKRGQQEQNYIRKGIQEQGGACQLKISYPNLVLYLIPGVNIINLIYHYRAHSAEIKELDPQINDLPAYCQTGNEGHDIDPQVLEYFLTTRKHFIEMGQCLPGTKQQKPRQMHEQYMSEGDSRYEDRSQPDEQIGGYVENRPSMDDDYDNSCRNFGYSRDFCSYYGRLQSSNQSQNCFASGSKILSEEQSQSENVRESYMEM